MPWSNQGGGPWGSGGGGKGPWGSGQQPSGPTPPDLEEFLRRSQDKLRTVLPGGSLGGKGLGLIVLAAIAIWGFSGFFQVAPDELGMRLVEDLRRGTTMRDVPEESLMLTGDENIVDVDFSVFWVVKPSGAGDYLFNIQQPE